MTPANCRCQRFSTPWAAKAAATARVAKTVITATIANQHTASAVAAEGQKIVLAANHGHAASSSAVSRPPSKAKAGRFRMGHEPGVMGGDHDGRAQLVQLLEQMQ